MNYSTLCTTLKAGLNGQAGDFAMGTGMGGGSGSSTLCGVLA